VTLLFIYALTYQMRSIHSRRNIVNECPLLLRVVKLDSPLLGVWTCHYLHPLKPAQTTVSEIGRNCSIAVIDGSSVTLKQAVDERG